MNTLIKLYRQVDETILYWEAWDNGSMVVIHRGQLGQFGETDQIQVNPWESVDEVIVRERRLSDLEGYREISFDDHARIIVQYKIEGWGSPEHIAKRLKVESVLNENLGWSGNGCCDGGDIGSGTINLFCFVIDPHIARDTIVDALGFEGLAEGAIIALEQDEEFEILWPSDSTDQFSYF